MNIKRHDDGGLALLAGAYIHRSDVDLTLRKYLGNIDKHADPVICVDLDLCGVALLAVCIILRLLPLCFNQSGTLL